MTRNEAAEAWGAAHTPTDRFTPQIVLDLLSEVVLESGATMPHSADPSIFLLAEIVNALRQTARWWTAFLEEEHPKNRQIAAAIMVLTETLPETRGLYVTGLAIARRASDRSGFSAQLQADLDRDIPGDPTAEAEADLAAFDALVTAALRARERGLPHLSNPIFVLTDRTDKWKHYAKDLERIFHKALPGPGLNAAAYRFIVAVTPTITGEQTTFLAVQSHLKKDRPTRRDRSKSGTVNRSKGIC